MDTGNWKPNPSLGNVLREFAELITLAATATGFNVWTQDDATAIYGRLLPDCVHVMTAEPRRDHGAFWTEYSRLKNERSTQEG